MNSRNYGFEFKSRKFWTRTISLFIIVNFVVSRFLRTRWFLIFRRISLILSNCRNDFNHYNIYHALLNFDKLIIYYVWTWWKRLMKFYEMIVNNFFGECFDKWMSNNIVFIEWKCDRFIDKWRILLVLWYQKIVKISQKAWFKSWCKWVRISSQ